MNRNQLIAGVVALIVVVGGVTLWTQRTSGPPNTPAASTTPTTSPASAPAASQAPAPAPAAPAAAPATPPAVPAAATTAASPSPTQAALPPPAQKGPPLSPDDRILGKADAPITIIEYASFTCPHCADFDANTLPKLKTDWIDTGKARLVFRDFPLDGAAVRAAMLARCAPPDQFYAFVDALFHNQTTWATGGKVDVALGKLAKLSGMTDDQFAACMKDEALQKRVLDSRLEGEQQFKVESTPTFIINGTQVVGAQPYAEFERVLNKAASSP
jgi:protein-disulfide isomerase